MTEQGRVLVVDDDETVRDVVRRYLEVAGFEVDVAGDGTEGLRLFSTTGPDLVVLDVMMPGLNGLEVCRRLRQVSQVPVVMLTALGEEENRIAGLQLGADDYVTKPFSPKELALRVASVLRRARMPRPEPAARVITDGDLALQMSARQAALGGVELPLTSREFDLLAFFLTHPGVAFSRADLLEKVWGWDFGDQSTVTVHVRRLREKIEKDPAKPVRVATVWGVGYRYDPVRR
ncbi:response regulator transcription factor [Amycolatopsis keratiniphila]|uniref:Two-component system response regulator n=2 Tax=Amycolatopsis keratiniphila TaxID=129921 RepID=R4T4A2_9PSEU|nr:MULTISPECIES: response regulator transcription factor [Amycolatopsis]AGM09680.1 two-component system response regulator [Amycolatopsis keratiniphila]OLZ52295.1 DNA-binding response regulator [Amycolatopsis keratiniphila subsp. nogabecina]ONF62229.1 DNA-binding response regulator [Amycolatopsis keratiniphila subsp. keratiniphila]RSN23375.1 DNA-binding response regulator [Amycolatopsis sp. WAC 04169]SDU62333.1 DNA-binding response regulator, OmpR family, contains REC and winged-helix (wHTH) d